MNWPLTYKGSGFYVEWMRGALVFVDSLSRIEDEVVGFGDYKNDTIKLIRCNVLGLM